MEGFWSLLRSWLRPHRGISQERLSLTWGFSSSFTTCESEAKRCWERSLSYSPQKTLESNKSEIGLYDLLKSTTLESNKSPWRLDIRFE